MAREIRIQRREGAPATPSPARGPVPRRRGQQPRTTEEARLAVEETRGRISATLDEIEDRIDHTREQIRDKANVLRPVRSRIRDNPLPAVGVALGTGLVLGLLTGGEEEEKKERKRRVLDEEERKELREWRAERRERLRDRFGRGAEGERRQQPSLMTHLAGAVASAAVAGLMARVRDKVMGRKAPEATERPEGVFTSTESFEHRYVA